MFPIAEHKLSFREISNYWSREIQPTASELELLGLLEKAWWVGEIRGDSPTSRLQLLQAMFKAMHDRDDLGIVFVHGEDAGLPAVTELPDRSAVVDLRRRIAVPPDDVSGWDERTCELAFRALAQTSSTESYPDITPGLALIELTYDEFDHWRRSRGYSKPMFWRPAAPHSLEKPKRGRPAEYNWHGVRSLLADYVSLHGPMRTSDELLQKCADFASELHPKNNTPSDKTIRDAIKTHSLDVAAGAVPGK
jgi:hypothetical protein